MSQIVWVRLYGEFFSLLIFSLLTTYFVTPATTFATRRTNVQGKVLDTILRLCPVVSQTFVPHFAIYRSYTLRPRQLPHFFPRPSSGHQRIYRFITTRAIVTGYGRDDRGSIPDRDRGFFLCPLRPAGSWAHPFFCTMDTSGPFAG
jgi:hypothetical protein